MGREDILLIHSIIGVLVFATGLLQIILKKGGYWHTLIGKIYLYGWLFLMISGAYLSGIVMTIVGVFGFYFALTGSRIGHLKNKSIQLFDKIIFVLGVISSLAMLFYAVKLYLRGDVSFGTILGIFGLIFAFTTVKDVFKYVLEKPLTKIKNPKMDWYFEHLTRMLISFIAAVTAFTSIQNVFGNNTVNFIAPTVIGTIAISLFKRNYRMKLTK